MRLHTVPSELALTFCLSSDSCIVPPYPLPCFPLDDRALQPSRTGSLSVKSFLSQVVLVILFCHSNGNVNKGIVYHEGRQAVGLYPHQETETEGCCPFAFPDETQSGIPAHEMVLPQFWWVFLPQLAQFGNSLTDNQGSVSMVILSPINWAIKMKHHGTCLHICGFSVPLVFTSVPYCFVYYSFVV